MSVTWSADTGADETQGVWASASEMEELAAEMMIEGVIYEGEGEDIDHKVRMQLMETAVEL